jgi:hypothetical protein
MDHQIHLGQPSRDKTSNLQGRVVYLAQPEFPPSQQPLGQFEHLLQHKQRRWYRVPRLELQTEPQDVFYLVPLDSFSIFGNENLLTLVIELSR